MLALFPLQVLTPMEELVFWRLDNRLVDIVTASRESDAEGGTDRVPGEKGLVDNRCSQALAAKDGNIGFNEYIGT